MPHISSRPPTPANKSSCQWTFGIKLYAKKLFWIFSQRQMENSSDLVLLDESCFVDCEHVEGGDIGRQEGGGDCGLAFPPVSWSQRHGRMEACLAQSWSRNWTTLDRGHVLKGKIGDQIHSPGVFKHCYRANQPVISRGRDSFAQADIYR